MQEKWKIDIRNYVVSIVLLLFLSMLFSTESYAATSEQINESINKGTQWLIQAQNENGNWGNNTKKDIIDTSEIAGFLNENLLAPLSVCRAVYWLQIQETSNNDFLARILPFMTAQAHDEALPALIACQNPDGGWGLAEGYASDIMDTVIVLNSLIKEDSVEIEIIEKGMAFLIQNQNGDGSWSYVKSGTGSVSLTAQTSILVNNCVLKPALFSNELSLALQKAGEFLISQNLSAPERYSEEMLPGTMLAYRAVFYSVGSEALGTVEDAIINAQMPDGSWNSDTYATILAVQALKEKTSAPAARIDKIEIFRQVINDEIEEAYSFQSYESVIIKVYGQYGSNAKFQVFVRRPDGLSVTSEYEGKFGWNTMNTVPGSYSVVAQLKDVNNGTIITSAEKQFDIIPSFKISDIIIVAEPDWIRVNTPDNINVNVSLFNQSNIERQVNVRTEVCGPGDVVITSTNETYNASTEQLIMLNPLSFTPDVSAEKDYIIRAYVFDNQTQIAGGQAVFKVLPPPPPIRIDVVQSLDKTMLYPESDNVTAAFKLAGEGMPEEAPENYVFVVSALIDPVKTGYFDTGISLETGQSIIITATGRAKYATSRSQETDPDGNLYDTITGEKIGQRYDGSALLNTSPIGTLLGAMNNNGVITRPFALGTNVSFEAPSDGILLLAYNDNPNQYYNNSGYYTVSVSHETVCDMAGRNVVFTTTLPVNSMSVDVTALQPAPVSELTNPDGSKTISWNFDKLMMGQEETIPIKYEGSSLVSDTNVVLTNSTKLTYQNKDDNLITVNLPDLTIPVSKTSISTNIATDKQQYATNEQVAITVDTNNLSDSDCTLSGLAEITDLDGNNVAAVSPDEEVSWTAGESKTFSYNWNTGQVIAGTYKVRISWLEGDKVISSAETPFEVVSNGSITNTVFTDKVSYTANDVVDIQEIITNTSTNSILADLTVRTQVYGQEGYVWNKETPLMEILPGVSTQIKSDWGVAQAVYGDYNVFSTVYRDDKVLCQDSAQFSVSSSVYSGQGITGSLDVLTKNICTGDDVIMEYTLTNQGNTNLEDLLFRITIVDPATGEVVDTITDYINLAINENISDLVTWSHAILNSGNYLVVCDLTLDDQVVVPLDSSYFIVKVPFEVTMQQIVRPRVLVWAESQTNIDMAGTVLNDMQVYCRIVNNRDAFFTELQTGQYNTYVMLNKSLPLTDHDDLVLTEEIAGGKGLVATGGSNGDNLKQFNLFGIKEIGSVNSKGYTTSFSPGSPLGEFILNGTGKVQRVLIISGQEAASIITEKVILPGAITHQYGEGKTVLMTFDLSEAGPAADAYSLFRNALERVAPVQETKGDVAEVEIKVQAIAAVEAMLTEEFPAGTEILWVSPEFASDNPPIWQFTTTAGQEYICRYIVKPLPGMDPIELTTFASYLEANEYKPLKTKVLTINVP
jgi:hypothetical protein